MSENEYINKGYKIPKDVENAIFKTAYKSCIKYMPLKDKIKYGIKSIFIKGDK